MSEASIYQQEILRLKKRVNTLIDVVSELLSDASYPVEVLEDVGYDRKELDKEELNKYNV